MINFYYLNDLLSVIIKDIKKEYDNGKNILVLTERLELMNYIYDKL